MAQLNQASLIGYLGGEPRIIATKSGTDMASLSLATTEKGFTRKDGTKVEDRTEWHNIVLWGQSASFAQRFLHKGSLVFVQGKLRTREYTDKQGAKRNITEIEADTIQLLERRDAQTPQQTQSAPVYGQQPPQPYQVPTEDKDLPF